MGGEGCQQVHEWNLNVKSLPCDGSWGVVWVVRVLQRVRVADR